MLAIILIPIYFLINFLLLKRFIKRLIDVNAIFNNKIIKIFIITFFVILSFSPILTLILSPNNLTRSIKIFSYYWLCIILYYLVIIFLIYLFKKIFSHIAYFKNKNLNKKKSNLLSIYILIGISLILIVGHANAKNIRLTNYDLTINKAANKVSNLKIALIADLHLGFNSGYQTVKETVEKINEQNPDLIIIAGDIFDNEISDIDDTTKIIKELKGLKSKYGVYATYGNHDVQEKIFLGFTFNSKNPVKSDIKMDELIKNANIKLLQDEGVLIDDSFYLFGRLDYQKLNMDVTKRKTATELLEKTNKNRPIIVIDHQPREYTELSSNGVDLDLSGHTHDGQIFPANLLLKLIWNNPYGYKKINNMHTVVTSGVGLFGPAIRLGTKAEIAIVNINFKTK